MTFLVPCSSRIFLVSSYKRLIALAILPGRKVKVSYSVIIQIATSNLSTNQLQGAYSDMLSLTTQLLFSAFFYF